MINEVKPIEYEDAKLFVKSNHYSEVMPRITKHTLGGFQDGKLVAVATLGWGTRPLHTVKKLFPSLISKDYLELGKLCLLDEMPKNSESFFISRILKWLKVNVPECLFLYSWADGIIGKPGYIYQASNFLYGGYIWTEMYLDVNGNRSHVRSIQGHPDLPQSKGRFKTRAFDEISKLGYTKYCGLQFRYIYPLCSKERWQQLLSECTVKWDIKYPKDKDCQWKKQIAKGKLEVCEKPLGITTKYRKTNVA